MIPVVKPETEDDDQESAMRDRFVAMLAHDLRNPLSAIVTGIELLERFAANPSEKEKIIVATMKSASARMFEMITNVMDFARTRLGEGIAVTKNLVALQAVLQQVIDELSPSFPGKTIAVDIRLPGPINCDGPRMAQLFSNLLGNALTSGAPGEPVRVRASVEGAAFELSVSNKREPIPADLIARLFEPFTHLEAGASQRGVGLGLFIASEIARAHDGEITAVSSESETRFTFRQPSAV